MKYIQLNGRILSSLIIILYGCTTSINNNQDNRNPMAPIYASGPILIPGSGFSGATSEPPANGEGTGSDAKVIARWDVVPHQEFTGKLNIGIVAFHMNGIERIEFSVENGPWTPVSQMALNQQVGVVEYFATLDAALFDQEGLIEIRAVGYPKVGIPRVLDSLFLYVHPSGIPQPTVRYASPDGNDDTGDGSQSNPFRSIAQAAKSIEVAQGGKADGGIVMLAAGNYSYELPCLEYDDEDPPQCIRRFPKSNTVNRWLTIQPASGVTREQVAISTSEHPGLNSNLIHLRNLTIRINLSTPDNQGHRLWLDTCEFIGHGQTVNNNNGWFQNFSARYATDCIVRDTRFGIEAMVLQRNTRAFRIGEDVFGRNGLLVNSTVDDVNDGLNAWHPDVLRLGAGGTTENCIVYGVRATNVAGQGIFLADVDAVRNVAYVNVLIAATTATSQFDKLDGPIEHVLMHNVTIEGQSFNWRTDRLNGSIHNISVRNSYFEQMGADDPFAEEIRADWFDNNHYKSGVYTPGTNNTTGDPQFVNPGIEDYRPKSSSPLIWQNRQSLVVDPPAALVPVDIDSLPWEQPTIGAYNGQ